MEIAQTVAIGECELSKAAGDSDSTCRKLCPLEDDWCLVCFAQQALENYDAAE